MRHRFPSLYKGVGEAACSSQPQILQNVRLELEASRETNPLKRLAKRIATRRKLEFCRDAIQSAELVFAHNAAVVERFSDVWNGRCHAFDRSFVTDEILISDLKSQISNLLDTSRPLRLICAGRQIRWSRHPHLPKDFVL